MKRLIPFALVLAATACGSTGTDSSGTGDDDDGSSGGFTCASITVGPGMICENTSPPTLRVDFGTGAGQAVPGDDPRLASIDPNKGRYVAAFVPSATEAPAGTANGPGPAGSFIIKNPATGKIGIRAADELCKLKNATFPNAHMCTNDEVLWNVRNGFITAGMTGMAYGTHQDPGLSGVRNSFKGNCGGLTYNSGDLAYTGTRWEAVLSDPKTAGLAADALVVNFVGGVPCSTVGTPIVCCQ